MVFKRVFLKVTLLTALFFALAPAWVRAAPPAAGPLTSGAVDRTALDITVYNNGFALIRDVRKINIPAGSGGLEFKDVPAALIPETVSVRPAGASAGLAVLEQSFRYDLVSRKRLLDKYVGKKIKIEVWNKFNDRRRVVEAELLSNNDGPVYRIGNRIYLDYPGIKVLPSIPGDLVERPAIIWLYKNATPGVYSLETNYLTNKIIWRADYLLVLNKDDNEGGLSGWVTVDNRSGATFKKAHLKLAAGALNSPGGGEMERAVLMEKFSSSMAPGFRERPLFEYHVYDLGRRTTIKDGENKQIAFVSASGIRIEKEYLLRGMTRYYTAPYRRQDPKVPVYVYVNFKNSRENHIGDALPAGTVRIFKEDADGALSFIGEDAAGHTPVDEDVRLKAGAAFDIAAEREQTDYRRISSVVYETGWEITLRNHKKRDITVGIIEPLSGSWSIVTSSHAYEKVDAFTIRFDVPVPAGGEVKVSFTARVEL